MTEADVINGLFEAITAILDIFSMFFAIISGYVAALYLFLAHAPLLLRLLAFGLLSVGLVFLGGTALVIQTMQEGLLTAWERLPSRTVEVVDLRNPLPFDGAAVAGLAQQELGVAVGWIVASAVYLTLGYLTFVYRWPDRGPDQSRP
ncbi:MAG: hypothetical protein NW217_12545 [Hyphomicrobiaceae bacterium]|nr:hypothetical protein [Hyphomicrobiaceae bacterium]